MQKQNSFSFILAIVCICFVGLGCINGKKLWRNYEQKPFDATEWRSGDIIERGTMSQDLIGIKTILEEVGNNKDEIIQTLGSPDKIRKDKIGENEATVLMYEMDLGEPEFFYALQIYLQDDKPVFANKGAVREKVSLLEKIKKRLNKKENQL